MTAGAVGSQQEGTATRRKEAARWMQRRGRRIAQHLVEAALEAFTRRGTRHVGLLTFAHSPKHLALYQKFGFWPGFTTAIMTKAVGPVDPGTDWSAYSDLPAGRQRACLEDCRDLA